MSHQRILGVAVVALLAGSRPCPAATIRVPADQPTIQAGIDAAAPGDVVLVAPGTYRGAGNTDLDFRGKDLEVRSEAGAASTIIDGEGSETVHRRAFYFHSGETSACVIEGFTITRCWGTIRGGAIHATGASATLRHCRFFRNAAWGHDFGYGGGVYCVAGASLSFEDCEFDDCGIAAATGPGGAAYLDASSASFTRCVFTSNGAEEGGAIWSRNSVLSLVDCRFLENGAGSYGGAIRASEGALTALRCEFRGNESGEGPGIPVGHGGAASLGGQYVLTECVFVDNATGWSGGAIEGGGLRLERCIFARNSAMDGGALYLWNAVISGCTFVENTGTEGSAIQVDPSSAVEVTSSILAFGNGSPAVWCGASSSLSVTCTDVFGNAGGDWIGCLLGLDSAEGNFSRNPRFCDAELEDFTLRADSPCLPGLHPEGSDCGLIGARDLGCGATSATTRTWGATKALFH